MPPPFVGLIVKVVLALIVALAVLPLVSRIGCATPIPAVDRIAPEHCAVRPTLPPVAGKLEGVGVIVQPVGLLGNDALQTTCLVAGFGLPGPMRVADDHRIS